MGKESSHSRSIPHRRAGVPTPSCQLCLALARVRDRESPIELTHVPGQGGLNVRHFMPVLGGIEVTRLLRAQCPEVRLIGLSMFEDREQAQAMQDAGAVAYVSKSAPAEELLAAIRGVV